MITEPDSTISVAYALVTRPLTDKQEMRPAKTSLVKFDIAV